jgi:hypothetical protein
MLRMKKPPYAALSHASHSECVACILARATKAMKPIPAKSNIIISDVDTSGHCIWWSAAGIEPSTVSILWSEAVAGEVFVFCLIGPALLADSALCSTDSVPGRRRLGRRGRRRAVVCGRRDNFRFGALNSPAAARLYLCPASSHLDLHDAGAGTRPSGRSIHLRVWLRLLLPC